MTTFLIIAAGVALVAFAFRLGHWLFDRAQARQSARVAAALAACDEEEEPSPAADAGRDAVLQELTRNRGALVQR